MTKQSITVGLKLDTATLAGITRAEVEEYAAVSGDRNPIHTDADLALRAGLIGAPVQGMLVMALVSTYVENWRFCANVKSLNVRFVSATIVDRELVISARVVSLSNEDKAAILRILVHQNSKPVCMGEAEVCTLKCNPD